MTWSETGPVLGNILNWWFRRRIFRALWGLQLIVQDFPQRVCLIDEGTFDISDVLNHHYIWICKSEQSYITCAIQGNSQMINVWCGMMHKRSLHLAFLWVQLYLGKIYLDVFRNFAVPQTENRYHFCSRIMLLGSDIRNPWAHQNDGLQSLD